jgi:TPR repeat protein
MSNIGLVRICGFVLVIFFSVSVFAQSDQDRAEALFKEGYTLYQQRYGAVAITSLEKAAELGHAEAAYWVGEILRKRYSYITAEAEQYYRQAAAGGEVYAMLRLGQEDEMCGTLRDCEYDREAWIDRAKGLALPEAEAGDTEAMMALSSAYSIGGDSDKDFEWVERAAENGDAFAQFWLAVMLDEQERGFYWTDEGRREDVFKWLKASADQGYPKAILKLAVEYKEDNRFKESQEWVDRMAKTDYFDALYEYALIMLDGPEGMYRYPEAKPVEGLAMLLAIHRERRSSAVKRSIDRARTTLSPEIITKAEKRSEELPVYRPIIFYLPKFGM